MSLPRYSQYKPSGVEWLGTIPMNWDAKRLKWLLARNDGGVWGADAEGYEGTIVLRSTEQTVDGRWQLDDPARRNLTEAERASALLEPGDLLVTKSSGSALHIGKTTLVDKDVAALGCCYSNFMQRIRARAIFIPKLLWYVLNNELARTQFDIESNSTTGLANLNGTIIGNLILPVPPNEDQRAIVRFLDRETAKIDALVSEQERLIALLKEKRQVVISRAVTKGLNPDAPMKPSGIDWLGDVPAHWDAVPLKHLISFQSGGTPSKDNEAYWDGEIPWASAKDMKREVLDDTADHLTQYAIDEGTASLVPATSVVVVVRGMILARTFPVTLLAVPMAINQDLKALLPTKALDASFLAWYLRGTENESLNRLDEAGHGTKALRMEAWSSLVVALPLKAEQKGIAEYLTSSTERLDALVSEARTVIEILTERRSALISAAVTGQIDVRNAA